MHENWTQNPKPNVSKRSIPQTFQSDNQPIEMVQIEATFRALSLRILKAINWQVTKSFSLDLLSGRWIRSATLYHLLAVLLAVWQPDFGYSLFSAIHN